MKAAFIEQHGPADSIRVAELPEPRPGPGDVVVKVGATAFNPVDLYLRAGTIAMPMSFPYVVGCDLAGTVVQATPGGRFRVGDRVWGSNQGLLGRQGTTAEFVAVAEDWLYPTPDHMSDAEAAAWALVGLTAHLGLFHRGQLQEGETVFVPGGSGGVGHLVIQMAKAVGARVATTAGGAERGERCRALGADLVLDHRDPNLDLAAALTEFAPEGIHLWYETQREPNLELSIPLLARRGRMILMAGRTATPKLPLGPFYTTNKSLLGFAMFNFTPDEQRVCAEAMNQWAKQGRLKPVIGATYPLERAAEAQAFLEANTLHGAGQLFGKVVVLITPTA
ncbi:Alcohol dehydrogenase zinc-binding domain protein [Isosphaera pallida ATCC 43644]|uniref:Alcohol dehydrogenase zinc-binding domain protein n=1 Tax=Isosphaera pallida (strain ATCC 43644 / DSM 9630 / IS1B) TaxID=575540 RepID=E8QXC5_ISOPI|nr:NADPH:quinone reductase [Isosphaera pallida]ADV61966.1 Alcohol dehydrogenase zinc-binding domain protein [Isosphaera pallida ATCC 43644]